MSTSISYTISDTKAENLIKKFRDKIENESSLKNSTRYCQIKSSESGQSQMLPISNLHELIERNQGNPEATNALKALDNFITKDEDKIMDLKEFREANPDKYRLLEIKAFCGASLGTQRILDYITAPDPKSAQQRLSDDEIAELGQKIIKSAPKNISEFPEIFHAKMTNLSKIEIRYVKRRLEKFFDNEIKKLEEQITLEWDLPIPDYETLGSDPKIPSETNQEFWKQNLMNFFNERENLGETDPETGLREHLIDCLYDFNLSHFKSDIEEQTCAYVTSITCSPYKPTQDEIKKLQERLDDAQQDKLDIFTESIDEKINQLEEIKKEILKIKQEKPNEIKSSSESNDTIQDPPLPLTTNSPTRPSEEIISIQAEGPKNFPRISELSFEKAEKQIQRLGEMIRTNPSLARLPKHLKEYACLSNLKSPMHSEIQELDALIGKSKQLKHQDLLAFKAILTLNPDIFENLRIFRLEFPEEYQEIITKHFEEKSLEIAVLDFLTGDTLIDRFCKSIIDTPPLFYSKMYETLISKNYHLNEMRVIPKRINKHLDHQIDILENKITYKTLVNYRQINYDKKTKTWSYLNTPIFQNTRSFWEDRLRQYFGSDHHLNIHEIDRNTQIRTKLIDKLSEFNFINFYDTNRNRNLYLQIEAFIICIMKYQLNTNEMNMLIKNLETQQKKEMPKTKEYQYYQKKIAQIKEIKDQIYIQLSDIEYNPDLKIWFVKRKENINQESVSSSSESTPSKTSEERTSDESPARSVKRAPDKSPEESRSSPIFTKEAIPNYDKLEEKDKERIEIDQFLRKSANLTVRQGIEMLSRRDSNGKPQGGLEEVLNFLYRLPQIP